MNENTKFSEEKLLEIFKSLNVPMSINDLKNPTKEFVISVFDTFLKDMQINLACPLLRPFDCLSHLDNPDLNEEALSYILLAATMNQILRNYCKIPVTITTSDINTPRPKKTKKILHFIIVIWNYVFRTHELFSQVSNNLLPEIQKSEEIIRECNNLEEKYQECIEKLSSIKMSKDELLKKSDVKEELCKKNDKTHREMVDEYQKLKEKENHLQTEKVNMDLEIATNKERLSELDQLILSSPEKIKTDVQRLKDMIKEVEEKILEKEQEKKEKKKENQSKVSSQEDLLKSKAKVQKLLTELQSLMESVQALTTINEKCQEENKELTALQSAQETKEVLTNFYEEKYKKIQSLKIKQIGEISQTCEMLQGQLSEERQQSDNLISSIAELEKNINNQVDSIVSIIKCCKNAEAETKKL